MPHDIKKLGIIAGGGCLPGQLLAYCHDHDIAPVVIGFDGQTDPDLKNYPGALWIRLGQAGQVIPYLRNQDVSDVVMIGGIRRPSLWDLRPDLKTLALFKKIYGLGDDGALKVLRTVLQESGLRIHGVHRFLTDLLAPYGPLGRYDPDDDQLRDIELGMRASQALGALDIGQAVVVQQGLVLGVEAIEGTDALITRCGALKRKGYGPILIKTCKPGQDTDLDLPTIGPDTVEATAKAGFSGLVMHAERSLIVDVEKVARLADGYKMFIRGIHV